MTIDTIGAALRRLELSEPEQTIYLSLLRHGQSTARMLADRTSLTRPSVYDQLKTLISFELVVEITSDGKAQFAAAELKHLEALLTDRIDRLEQSREQLLAALPLLADSIETVVPKIRFFEGSEGVKQILKDIMWNDTSKIQMVWPYVEMNQVFDEAFLRWFDERRQVRTLSIELLASLDDIKQVPSLFTSGSKDTYHVLAKKVPLTSATIIYGSKVAFISSRKEAFGFIVESTDFVTLEKLKFMALLNP